MCVKLVILWASDILLLKGNEQNFLFVCDRDGSILTKFSTMVLERKRAVEFIDGLNSLNRFSIVLAISSI